MTAAARGGVNDEPTPVSPRMRGFSLIELTIVIAIMGLLLGGLLVPLGTQVDIQRYNQVEHQLTELERTLFGFAVLNSRLPCADKTGDGVENGGCAPGDEGFVPWVTLGINGVDAWGRPYRYRVDSNFTTSIPLPPDTTESLLVQDRASAPLTIADPDAAVAVIFSCGKNGIPDAENDDDGTPNVTAGCGNSSTPSNATYTQGVFTENVFDDALIWISKNALIGRMVQANAWP